VPSIFDKTCPDVPPDGTPYPDVPLDPDEPLVPEDPDVPSDPPATRTSQLAMSLGGGGDPIGMLNIFVCTVYVMFSYKTESPL
jgi:hypothetical protein